VASQAGRLAEALNHYIHRHGNLAALVRLLGPAPASLTKLKDRHRWQLLLKSYGREALREALEQVRRLWTSQRCRTVDLTLDIDPGNLL